MSGPTPDLESVPLPEVLGGGGTGFIRKSPEAVLPQLFRSRLTCDGGGATMAGAGRVSLAFEDESRAGAATGGGTTSAVGVKGARELARSRCVSRGAGATTVGASDAAVRVLSRETLGAGGMMEAFKACEVRVLEWETSGAGGTILAARALAARLVLESNSGVGGTALTAGKTGAVSVER